MIEIIVYTLLEEQPLLEQHVDFVLCFSITESILNVIKVLRPYWKCLQYQGFTSDPCPYEEVNQLPPK